MQILERSMKWQYCWRCREELPMLDDEEFAVVAALYHAAFRVDKKRIAQGLKTDDQSIAELFHPVVDAYEKITGYRATNANAVMHHCLSQFGPPCSACGKPLRTPKAARCVECGKERVTDEQTN
jgi:hypothetical protein